jgi:hypothetical protein
MGKSISLYEMTTDLVDLMEVEEINEEVKAEIMEQVKATMEAKSENIIAIVKNYEARIEAIKGEEKRLAEYRRVEENKLNRLREYTVNCMEVMGNKKLETNLGRISLRKKPDNLIILDENQVPDIYKTIKEIISVDKKAIKEAMKNEVVEGCRIETGGKSLIIK